MPRKPEPMALSPLVALAERATEEGAVEAVLVTLDREQAIRVYHTDASPRHTLAGLLSIAQGIVFSMGDEQEEDGEGD